MVRRHYRCSMALDEAEIATTIIVPLAGARQAPLVLAHAAAYAADNFFHRAASGERRGGLGKRDSLLRHHPLRLDPSRTTAARELQKPQGHNFLRFAAKPRSIESKCHPVRDHVLPH